MQPHEHVEFDYTLAEAADFQLAYIKTTREGRSWRKREQTIFAIAVVFTVAVYVALTKQDRPVVELFGAVAIAIVVALIFTIPIGWLWDVQVRRRTTRLLNEKLGPGPHRCAIRIEPDALRVAQEGIEYAFPWNAAESVEDTPEGILITFKTGRSLVRSRGFTSAEHRAAFLQRVRELAT